MPFSSKKQQRMCYALQSKGQAGTWDCAEWSGATDFQDLPETTMKEKKSMSEKTAFLGQLAQSAARAGRLLAGGGQSATNAQRSQGATTVSGPAAGKNTTVLTGKPGTSVAGKHVGHGHSAIQSRNNALYGQPSSPGFKLNNPKPAPAASGLGKSSQEKKAMQRQEAVTKMAAFVRYLGDKIPVGTKAAQLESNLRRASKLHKLAAAIEKHQNIIKAVDVIYPEKSAAYKHRVVQGLIRGLSRKIKEAQAKKASSAMGMSKHPSAGMTSGTSPVGGKGIRTTGPLTQTSVLG